VGDLVRGTASLRRSPAYSIAVRTAGRCRGSWSSRFAGSGELYCALVNLFVGATEFALASPVSGPVEILGRTQ
jgi:hypothetical protein